MSICLVLGRALIKPLAFNHCIFLLFKRRVYHMIHIFKICLKAGSRAVSKKSFFKSTILHSPATEAPVCGSSCSAEDAEHA